MIIHIDLDAFFVSCERLRHPYLKGRPVAVGGRGDPFIFQSNAQARIATTPARQKGAFLPSVFYDAQSSFADYFVEGKRIRGIIITASYEARAFGIRTGMTVREALQRCPELLVLPPNHLFYHTVSRRLREWLARRIPRIEQYSIDEFFGDLSGWVDEAETERFCATLRRDIARDLSLPVSIGAAPSKWIAKMATKAAKPPRGKGVRIVMPREVESFVDPLPIDAFPGIGRGFARRLRNYRIETLGQLRSARHLLYRWKKPGQILYHRVNGDDNEPVEPDSPRRSVGISRTIDPVYDRDEIRRRLSILCRHLAHLVHRDGTTPHLFCLNIRYEFGQKSTERAREEFLFSEWALRHCILHLFDRADRYPSLAVVRLAVRCSELREHPRITPALAEYDRQRKAQNLWQALTDIRQKYGLQAIIYAQEKIEKTVAKKKQSPSPQSTSGACEPC